jgi:hypothetical protein
MALKLVSERIQAVYPLALFRIVACFLDQIEQLIHLSIVECKTLGLTVAFHFMLLMLGPLNGIAVLAHNKELAHNGLGLCG